MDPVKNALKRTQEVVSDHKVEIAVFVAVAITGFVCIKIQRSAINGWNDFLEQEGLIEKFYNPNI